MTKRPGIRRWLRPQWPTLLLLICGIFGLVASVTLTLEKIRLLQDPGATPSCSLNPIITCTSAMSSAQAEVFGIPNSLIGVVAYTSLIAIAGLLLLGTKLPRAVWDSVVVTAFLGTAAMMWLLLQSVFVLHVICPWCFGVWVTTPVILLSSLKLYAGQDINHLPLWLQKVVHAAASSPLFIGIVWCALLLLLLGGAFWNYWSTLL